MRRAALLVTLTAVLACDGGLEPLAQTTTCTPGLTGICGTVVFRGAIPESTAKVFIVAFAQFPQAPSDLFLYTPLAPPNLPLPDSAADSVRPYALPIPAGRYEWVLAVWQKQGTLTFGNADSLLRETGYYRNPADTTLPGVVNVYGGGTDSINFVIDFNNMHPVSYYFPAAIR